MCGTRGASRPALAATWFTRRGAARPLLLRWDPATFWSEYWKEATVDPPLFVDLDIYPIHPTLRHLKPEDKVLECGFGGGRVIRHLSNTGYSRVIGVEYERGAAQRLAAVQRLPLTVADVRALPFADGTFDATLAFGVLGGLESDLGRGLAELIRVTRPGGLVVVSLMLDNLARRLQSLLGLLGNRPPRRFYAWRDTTRGWREHLGKCGLTIVEHSFMNSRYNFYYWTPLLRKTGQAFDHAQARVCDRLFPLNAVGETLFRLSTTLLPTAFAGAVLYVCRKQARGQ